GEGHRADADVQGQGGHRQGAEGRGLYRGVRRGRRGNPAATGDRPEVLRGAPGHREDRARIQTGTAHLQGEGRYSARDERVGHRHRFDLARPHDRPQGARDRRRRRSDLHRRLTEKTTMSRIGNSPIKLPPKVEVTLAGGEISVKGPLGSLSQRFSESIAIEKNGDTLTFKAASPLANAMHGTVRALVANMVKGVTAGYEKRLALVGVGYRAQAAGDKLNLSLGFSHPVVHKMPKGVKVETPLQTEIVIKGVDKQQVGQVAAEIRAYRPPEPYKGKGVRYVGERVVIKETKKK